MKLYTIKCAPGSHLSWGSRAFTADSKNAMGVNRIQRERLGRTAGALFPTVITDVPGSTSALSFVRRS